MADRAALVRDLIAAARYWRASQTTPGAPYQGIDHAHRALQKSVDAYEAFLAEEEKARHPDECECADCWAQSNLTRGPA